VCQYQKRLDKTNARPFECKAVPEVLAAEIQAGLKGATTTKEVKAVFEQTRRNLSRKRTPPSEGNLDHLLTEYEDLIKVAVEKAHGVSEGITDVLEVKAADFDESEHPRDNDGKFTSGSGTGSSGPSDNKKPASDNKNTGKRGKNRPVDFRGRDKAALASKIEDMCDESFLARNENEVVSYADVTQEEAKRIKEATGIDVDGLSHSIDNDFIRHIYSEHGNPEVEEGRGQVPTNNEDIKRIPDIIANPDKIRAGVTKEGKDAVIYEKRVNGTIIYVEEVRTGRGNLAAETLRKHKVGASQSHPDYRESPST